MSYEDAIKIHDKYSDELLTKKGVHMVGIGYARRGGEKTEDLAIICFVLEKLPSNRLEESDIIPRKLDGVPTDVMQCNRMVNYGTFNGSNPDSASDSDTAYLKSPPIRPLVGGLQLAIEGGTYGTLGFLAKIKNTPKVVAVSNSHVLLTVGTQIWQGENDKYNLIGTTAKSIINERVDAGYVSLDSQKGVGKMLIWDNKFKSYDTYPVYDWDNAYFEDIVKKTGSSSGTTNGVVLGTNVKGIRMNGSKFTNQIFLQAHSGETMVAPGDSGAALVRTGTTLVGLLWGGESGVVNSPTALACQIQDVLDILNINVLTSTWQEAENSENAPLPNADELYARIRTTANGKNIADFLIKYGPEVADLIRSDRRVFVVWKRRKGQNICNLVIENVAIKTTPLPATLMGKSTIDGLEAFYKVLVKRGSPELKMAMDAIRADVEWLIDRPYSEVVNEKN